MAKKIIQHIWRKKVAYLLSVLTVAVGIGFYASFFLGGNAHALSGVVLDDTDTMGFGLDGRDFSVTWTPGDTAPNGYLFTQIYITTSGVSLVTSTVNSTGCYGSACQPVGYFNQYTVGSMVVPQYMQKDSTGANWATSSNYVAWIYVSTTNPGDSLIASSSAKSYASAYDIVADTQAPQIDHSPVYLASSSAAAYINAFIFDNQTEGGAFADTGDGGNEYFRLYYTSSTNPWVAANSSTAVAYVGQSDLFRFEVPTSSVPATGGQLKYYLVAVDATGNAANTRYFCASPSAASAADCQNNPIVVNTVSAGARSITGTITSAGTPLPDVYVFAGGWAGLAVQTNGSGQYSVPALPNNNTFDINASQIGYCRTMRTQTIGTANITGVDMTMNSGMCGFYSGEGGGSGGGAPTVMFSGPPDGMQGAPVSGTIRVGFNQPMDGASINDANAGDAGSNVYLTTDTGTTKIAGSVTYCSNNASPGCSSLFSMDNNVILFSPNAPLATGTFYSLVMTASVKGQGGQSISGNIPGGGHKINFFTMMGDFSQSGFTMGSGGQFMPPYVKSMFPGPGMNAAPNSKISLEFSEAMNPSSINTSNIVLWNITAGAGVSLSSVTMDSNESKFALITPQSALTSGSSYELRVKGAVANSSGITMRPPDQASSVAFSSQFVAGSSNDTTAPTIYPMTATSSILAVNGTFGFGFNEKLDFNTVGATNFSLYRGATAVGFSTKYDSSANNLYIVPNSVLISSSTYTLTFNSTVKDLASNRITTTTYTYSTGGADTTAPSVKTARCDDYTCRIEFTESMNHDSQVDSNWVSSTVNHARFLLDQGGDKIIAGTSLTYNPVDYSVTAKGVVLTAGANFTLTVSGVTDISGNVMSSYSLTAPTENSAQTFGNFEGGGMFGPPTGDFMGGGGIGGGEFKPMGFGSFTADQFAFGQADMAFPFNPTAGQDSNVFQVKFSPNVAIQDGDKLILTFPGGAGGTTGLTSVATDTFSPFNKDVNGIGGAGTVIVSAISGSAVTSSVTMVLGVSGGTPGVGDSYTIDLKKLVNPTTPKNPMVDEGYKVGIQVVRAGTVLVNKTTMPYFVMPGGTNTLNVQVIAGTATSSPTSGADGTLFLHGGGPGGPMDKQLTLTDGMISAIDGVSGTSIQYANLTNGCYFIGTDPLATLGGNDYFGQMSPEPICLNGSVSTTKYLLLTPATGSASVTATIKIAGITNFGGVDVDIFAGGPGKFVVKTLSALGAPDANGYVLKLPANGNWFIGMGPAMSKTGSMSMPKALPGVSPAPIDIIVSNMGSSTAGISRNGTPLPSSVSFNDTTDVITFTFAAADKTVAGTVKDGSGNPLGDVSVFMHKQGLGAPVFATTNAAGATGTFSMAISDYGSYEIGAYKDGMPPVNKSIDIKTDGADAGTDSDVFLDGKQITGSNPLVLTMKKPAYSISGKVLDSSNNGISYVSLMAVDANGNSAFGMSQDGGNYTLFVDAGSWTVKAQLPPDKSTDSCGAFSTTVTVTNASQSGKNISPVAGTCYTLSGTVTVGGGNLTNSPLFIEEWDSANSRPVAGGSRKGASTDSSGAYSVKVSGNTTYRIGTYSPDYGELYAIKAVGASDTSQNITVAATSTISFVFTGGAASMNGFLELKNSEDATKRVGKQLTGLNTTQTVTVASGATYNYFFDAFGVGKFSGQVVAGNTATVNLGMASTNFVTVTGTIYSNAVATTSLEGVLVSFTNTSTGIVETALTNASGTYSVDIKAGSYQVSADIARYLPGEAPQIMSFTTNTSAYDFGGSSSDQSALIEANRTLEGKLNNSSGSAMSEGFVWAENASGTVVSAPINSASGIYSLPVTDGAWTIKGVGPQSAETTKSGTVTVSGSNSTGNDFNLTSDSAAVPTSTTGVIAVNTGGSINDSSGSGIKLTAGAGVLDTGSSNMTINMEKTYGAPSLESYSGLGNAVFDITLKEGSTSITDLKGKAEIQLNYTDLLSKLPSGVSESDLQLMYYSPERDQYVPVEGGFTVDATNNTITGQTDHMTEFVIAYAPPVAAVAAAPAASVSGISIPMAAPSQTTPTVTTTVNALATTLELATPSNAPSALQVVVANSASAVSISNVATVSFQPGATMKFDYQYQNGDKAMKIKVVRQLLNSKGKGVAKSMATRVLKPNAIFKANVKEMLSKKLAPGQYTERMRVYNAKTNKLIDENSFSISIEKLKKKVFIFGVVDELTDSPISFDAVSLAKVKSDVTLPVQLKLKYFYTNTTDEAQTVKMVRELFDANGKVISAKSGKWKMSAYEKDSVSFNQPVAGNLPVGGYTIKIRAYDWNTKEMLAENSLNFMVELK